MIISALTTTRSGAIARCAALRRKIVNGVTTVLALLAPASTAAPCREPRLAPPHNASWRPSFPAPAEGGGRYQALISTDFKVFISSRVLPVPSATRINGDRHRQPGRMAQDEIEIAEQRAAAGQHDALVDDVGGEFGGGVFEGHLDRLDNR